MSERDDKILYEAAYDEGVPAYDYSKYRISSEPINIWQYKNIQTRDGFTPTKIIQSTNISQISKDIYNSIQLFTYQKNVLLELSRLVNSNISKDKILLYYSMIDETYAEILNYLNDNEFDRISIKALPEFVRTKEKKYLVQIIIEMIFDYIKATVFDRTVIIDVSKDIRILINNITQRTKMPCHISTMFKALSYEFDKKFFIGDKCIYCDNPTVDGLPYCLNCGRKIL